MNYIQEAQERVYKRFISEHGHRDIDSEDEKMSARIAKTRLGMREKLFGGAKWYYDTGHDTGVI